MADVAVDIAPSFGAELRDGFKPVNAWVTSTISWLDDIQQFYRERSVIEREYSAKLSALAKKYYEKKAKKTSTLSVGDTPTITPGSLESASMTTWSTQLNTLERRAEDHDRFANLLLTSLADPVLSLMKRSEELRKQHAEYAAKLEKERDATFGDLKKIKGKYDGSCQEVENRRKKSESGFDRSKQRAQYEVQLGEMKNMKNTYLIAINVTNKQKERYYHEYVPELLDSLQSLSETKTSTLNSIWLTATGIEKETLSTSIQHLDHLRSEIPRNNPTLDSMMFVRHNTTQWSDPPDFAFEPSPVWLDDSNMATDAASKTFLMNILSKSKGSLPDLKRAVESERKEVEGAQKVRQLIREGKDKRDEVEVVRAQFQHQELVHSAQRKLITAEMETLTITSRVGDISRGARNHTFKPQTFKIPTNCDFCAERIWGLSAKGLMCAECGFTCHTKCELKCAADCPGELTKEQRKSAKSERQSAAVASLSAAAERVEEDVNGGGGGGVMGGAAPGSLVRSDTIGSMNTLSSGYAASAQRSVSGATTSTTTKSTLLDDSNASVPVSAAASSAPATATRRRIVAPPPTSYRPPSANGELDDAPQQQQGKMLYPYTATGPDEISVDEAQEFTLLDPDDGSGWIKIKPAAFGSPSGLVPAAYAEISASPTLPSTPAAPAPPPRSLPTPTTATERPISTATTNSASGSDTGNSSSAPEAE